MIPKIRPSQTTLHGAYFKIQCNYGPRFFCQNIILQHHIIQNNLLFRKNILIGWAICQLDYKWRTSNEQHVTYYLDPWLSENTTLRSLISGPFLPHEEHSTIENYNANASWQLSNLSFQLPDDILQQIRSIYLPHASLRFDKIIWTLTKDAKFLV